jgi:predicted nuclease of restriction endonuclease-like (RecB) superfamily
MKQIVQNGWSYDTLVVQIKSKVHERQGTLINNFDKTLAQTDSNWAKHLFKDPIYF